MHEGCILISLLPTPEGILPSGEGFSVDFFLQNIKKDM